MIRNEDRVLADRFNYKRRKHAVTPPRDDAHALAVVDFQFHRRVRMDLDIRIGTLFDEKSNASRLVAGQVLVDDASARQNQWKLFVRRLLRRLVFDCVKLSFTIRMIEMIFEQARRTRMILRRAGPEDAVVLLYLFPRDAVVIGVAATRSDAHFIEDCEWAVK